MEFDPSRFLTEDGQKVVTPDAFIPFSIGMALVVNTNFDRCKNNYLGQGLSLSRKELVGE